MVKSLELRNESGLQFDDISGEVWREYTFNNCTTVRINNPVALNVSNNGHRILDNGGVSHYIPLGWIHLCWQVQEGKPHFIK